MQSVGRTEEQSETGVEIEREKQLLECSCR